MQAGQPSFLHIFLMKSQISIVPNFKEVIHVGFFFNKDQGKNKAKDHNAVQGALEDAGQALKGDPLQEAVRKKKNNR